MPTFFVKKLDDRAEIYISTPDLQDSSLIAHHVDESKNLAVIVIGRLFYREDSSLSVAQYILNSYHHQGIKGLERIEGEYAFVLIDLWNRRVIAQRDPMGSWPLYWRVDGEGIAISSSLNSLTGHCSTAVSERYLAKYFSQMFGFTELNDPETVETNVQRVVPGSQVVFNQTGSIRVNQYWIWEDQVRPMECSSPTKILGEFRERLLASIAERIHGSRIAAHFSGGMDSTAVANAASMLKKMEGNKAIVGLSLVHEAAELREETRFIQAAYRHLASVRPYIFNADQATGFDWFDSPLPIHDEPFGGLWAMAALRALTSMAYENDSQTVITGFGGDDIQTCHPTHIVDDLWGGRFLRVLTQTRRWAASRGVSTRQVFRQAVLSPLMFRLSPNRFSAVATRKLLRLAPWLRKDFVKQHQIASLMRKQYETRYGSGNMSGELTLGMQQIAGDWSRTYLHAPLGMWVSHPFLDPRVISYSLSIPADLRLDPNICKPVLANSMKDFLPESVRNRRRKVGFCGQHARGFERNFSHIVSMIESSRLELSKVVDKTVLIECLHRQRVRGGGDSAILLDRILSVYAWDMAKAQHRTSPTEPQYQFTLPFTSPSRFVEDVARPRGVVDVLLESLGSKRM